MFFRFMTMYSKSLKARVNRQISALLSKLLVYVVLYWDIIVVVLLSSLLSSYLVYFNCVKWTGSDQSNPWWVWPSYNNWKISGNAPKFGDYLNASHPLDIELKPRTLEFTKIRDSVDTEKEKLMVFNKPAFNEEIPYPLEEGKCGGKCVVSYDTELLYRADAVLFHFANLIYETELPTRRHPNQLYVWINQESPSSLYRIYKENLERFNNTFNLTMTYRRDSDIYFPYFNTADIIKEIKNDTLVSNMKELITRKRKLIAWMSGNCHTKGAVFRLKLMLEFLELGLDVDLYGSCFLNSLEGTWQNAHMHLLPYKFYFAMENSLHCRDYITEKTWWNSLRAGVVPVIWGPTREDVEALLPPGSFIFMEDFSTPQKLIDYLLHLDTHMDEYLAYFKWRELEVKNFDQEKSFCQLCRLLHNDDLHRKEFGVRPKYEVESVHAWWYYDDTKTCLTPFSFTEVWWGGFYLHLILWENRTGFITSKGYHLIVMLSIIGILVIRRFVRRESPKNSKLNIKKALSYFYCY